MTRIRRLAAWALLGLASSQAATPETWVIHRGRLHLRSGVAPEWDSFSRGEPDARRLDVRFLARPNDHEATLFIRQDDVKSDWWVELNNQRLGKLFLMEAELIQVIAIPAGALREGENLLSILPPKENDDILVDDIRIDLRTPVEAVSEATLELGVSDEAKNQAIPCRFTLVNAYGGLVPLVGVTNLTLGAKALTQPLAVRPGVVYTATGSARIGLAAGDYTVYASRGFEWSVATQRVQVAAGEVGRLRFALRREVSTPGWVSCDTHVHTLTHSRHGDATIEERMLTLAGEGIELPVATDHNLQIDYTESAGRMGAATFFTPVVGNEVTTPAGHFNIFPVHPEARVPDFKLTDWPRLMSALRGTPGVRVVVLNHPRNVHNGFQPFAATNFNAVSGENKRGPEFSFDAMELLNSSAQQTDYTLVYDDWFALLNHGYRITAVGSSDVHDVSRYIVGQGRTYIACPDENPDRIDIGVACSNLLAGRALVSMGLLVQMTVDGRFLVGDLATGLGQAVRVQVEVSGPTWVAATNVALFANGLKVQETHIEEAPGQSPSSSKRGMKTTIAWTLPRPSHDVYLVAIATGPAVAAPFWAIPKPYQPTSPHWEGRVIGSTNPIWLDADGDGGFTPARGYARRLMATHSSTPSRLLVALDELDEAVAAQAASLYAGSEHAADDSAMEQALTAASPKVRRAFAAYAAAAR